MCKNTTPHQRSVGSCVFIAKIIKNRTIDEVISKSQGLNGVYPKIDVPPSFPLGLFHFGVCKAIRLVRFGYNTFTGCVA